MNRDEMEKLRLDRRLIDRRGWISRVELEKELEALPDVSQKIAPLEDADPPEAEPAEEAVPETVSGLEVGPPRVD
jgi:hypothetical protein